LTDLDKRDEISSHFKAQPFLPLGKYFETLVHYAIQVDSYFNLVLKNHPVYQEKITTGEIDLIIKRSNNQMLEHWEIALKFYLQHAPNDANQLIGPTGNDTLASKLHKLESKQLPLGQHPSVIEVVGSTPTSKLFLKGIFFHHFDSTLQLENANPNAKSGWWIYESELKNLESINTEGWSILQKSDWIGPSLRKKAPDFDLPRLTKHFSNSNDLDHRGICIAGYKEESGTFIESTRGFVMRGSN
jgi:hypothetical protein